MKSPFRLPPLVIVLVGVLAAGAVARAEIVERVLVKINGEILTQTELETMQSRALRDRRVNPTTMSNAELMKALAEITPQLLVDAVDEVLLLQRGKELGYKLNDDRFKQILDNIKKENKIETEEQLQAALKAEGMTMADLRKQLERSMILQQVKGNEVMARISITEAEGRAYFEGHRNEFVTPATMMLREILVSVPVARTGTFSVGQDEAAKARADALLARAKAGESFEKLVAEASDAPSKGNGGLIGPISLNDLEPTLKAVFESLKQGDLTTVLRTAGGYQIYKVETLTPSQELGWDQAKDEIGNRVAQSKESVEFAKYLAKMRAQAVIDWKNAELKRMYDEQVAKEEVPTVPTAPTVKRDQPLAPKKDEQT